MQPTAEEFLNAAFPHATRDLAVRETHLSIIVLTGDYAYKIKKAVRLDFIDARSLERRRELCREELRLNQRYAADLYLDVTPIVRTRAGLCFEGAGEPAEYAVRMRQFDGREELHRLIRAGGVGAGEIELLAARIADAHRNAPVSTAPPPQRTLDFLRLARANLASVERDAGLIGARDEARAVQAWMNAELDACAPRLEEREREGRVRECHGDLHARNVVRWRGALTPFDCIEFDPALRMIDALGDAAFLVMDLQHLGRSDIAYAFLNRYLEITGDYRGLELMRCFEVHLALVRAKVDLVAASQHANEAAPQACARGRLVTARRLSEPLAPLLIVMHGASGSGKSWLSEQLAPALGAVRIRSDVERKRLAGMDPLARPTQGSGEGLYTREMNERTYAHLETCARACIRGGLHIIVDAAFLEREERDRLVRLARTEHARVVIVACFTDSATLAARIEARARASSDPSDATRAVLERQLATMEPLAPDEMLLTVRADTRSPDVLDEVLNALRAVSDGGP